MDITVDNPSIKNWLKKVMQTKKNTKAPGTYYSWQQIVKFYILTFNNPII